MHLAIYHYEVFGGKALATLIFGAYPFLSIYLMKDFPILYVYACIRIYLITKPTDLKIIISSCNTFF